ncbi:hypothetical protein NQ317_017558, partial [Molorchus minor]
MYWCIRLYTYKDSVTRWRRARIIGIEKNFCLLNVQVVGDSQLMIRNIVCRCRRDGQHGYDSLLVGNSGYGIKKYLKKHLLHPQIPALGIKLNVDKEKAVAVATAVLIILLV